MENSKEICQKANIVPKLQLAVQLEGGGVRGTGPHKVKLISDKIVKGTEYQTGKERYEVKYLVEEDGEKKSYSVAMKDQNDEVHYLVQRLAEVPEGTEVILEYKRRGLKGYIDVQVVGEEPSISSPDVLDEEIPVIEDPNENISPNNGEGEFDTGVPVED